MAKHKQPTGYMPGIYFNLPEDEYHKDKALSHSGIVDILESERDYYENSPLNPAKEFKETDALKFGKRCHMFLLEEKKFLATHTVAGSGWHKDKITVTSNEFSLIKESTHIIRSDKDTSAYFEHGYPEVSIFVICPATGIRLRIRVDYLRTFGFVDLKRVRSLKTRKLGYDAAQYGWDIQEWLYRYVIGLAKDLLRAGKIKAWDATDINALREWKDDAAWLQAFVDDKDVMCRFFAQRSVRPYIYRVWYFDDHILAEAQKDTELGISKYKRAIETYGETGWPYGSAKAEKFSIDKMARRDRED